MTRGLSKVPGGKGIWLTMLAALAISSSILLALAVAAKPAEAAVTSRSVEAEKMRGAGKVFRDRKASNNRAKVHYRNGAASTRVRGSIRYIAVRARGDRCGKAPRMKVMVDGKRVMIRSVKNQKKWRYYATRVRTSGGIHRVKVIFTNDRKTRKCDRNLRADKVRFRLVKGSSTSDSGSTTYKPPVNITKGGTYSGAWRSPDPNVPAVKVATRAPVVLENCNLRSKGNLVQATVSRANVTVRNCQMSGLHPGTSGAYHGYAFYSDAGMGRLIFENNRAERTRGVLVRNWTHGTNGEKYQVRYNEFVNIDGRRTSSATGYSSSDHSLQARMAGVGNVHDVPNFDIAWNRVTNHPGSAAAEDVISFYGSGGNSTNPYRVHNNLIDGAFGSALSSSYSGGGIITDGGTVTKDSVSQWLEVYDNVVLDSLNYGVKTSQGHNNQFYRNTVIRDGKLLDGTVYLSPSVSKANTGSGIALVNPKNQPSSIYYRNVLENSLAGWYDPRASSGQRNFYNQVCSTCAWANNAAPWDTSDLTALEQQKREHFSARAKAAGITIGPTKK